MSLVVRLPSLEWLWRQAIDQRCLGAAVGATILSVSRRSWDWRSRTARAISSCWRSWCGSLDKASFVASRSAAIFLICSTFAGTALHCEFAGMANWGSDKIRTTTYVDIGHAPA